VPLSATPESNLPHEQELVKLEKAIIADEETLLVANESKAS
jgi:cytochrome c oxidase subunit I